MGARVLSRPARFAIRLIRTYQLEVRHRLGARCADGESCSDYALRMYRHHGFVVASVKTAARVVSCRPVRRGVRRRLVAAGGMVLIAFALWGGPAVAQVEGPCTITFSTGGRTGDVNSHSTPGTALPVRYGQILRIDTVSTGAITSHLIELELAGIPWTADQGLDSGNTWGGEINVSSYAGGYGLHKVTGVSFGPGACSGTAYVLVEGGNPLGGPVGAGAAAATGVGALALATTTVRAGKEGPDSVEEVNPHVPSWEPTEFLKLGMDDEPRYSSPPDPWAEGLVISGYRTPLPQSVIKWCLIALPGAILATMATMAAGAGAAGAPQPYALRRVGWRPRISIVGLGGGFLLALGILVLLQQYGVVYPTLTVTVVGLALGVLTSIVIPSLVRIANVRRINRVIAAAELRLNEEAGSGGEVTEAAEGSDAQDIPADWYPDPSGEARLRYWDGTDWTDDTAD